MNGILTATYRGTVTRTVTAFSLRNGTTIERTAGQEVDIREDHYGNTYVLIDGNDESLFNVARISEITWHADGLKAKLGHCDEILEHHSGPDGDADVRTRVTEEREEVLSLISEGEG